MGASVTTKGVKKSNRELRELGKRIQFPKPALKRIGTYMRGLSMQAFRSSADPETGRAWEPLSEATIKARRNKGRSGTKPLVDTGTLRGSVHSMLIGKQSVAVGSNLVYAGTHQFGRSTTWGRSGATTITIPARPFLGVDSMGMQEIERMMRKYLETGQ